LLLDSWMRWDIALSRFSGVDLNSVEKVYIGFGERGAAVPTKYGGSAQAGGNGIVQFDDLGLYKSRCVAEYASPDLTGDCIIGYEDIDRLQSDWLEDTIPVNPGTGNLVAHYEFEDNADDSTSATPEQDGVKYGDSAYTTGKIGSKALSFDPVDANDYVVVEDANGAIDAEFSTGSFTVGLWVKTESVTPDGHLICNGTDGGDWAGGLQSGKNYRLFFVNSSLFQFKIDDDANDSSATVSSSLLATDDWVHVTGIRNTTDGVLELYVDGLLWSIGNDNSSDISSPNEPLIIGGQADDVNNVTGLYTCGGFYAGELDDIRLYDKALTVGEVIYLVTEGGPTPDELKKDTDLNLDNYVDLKDYAVLADAWLDDTSWP